MTHPQIAPKYRLDGIVCTVDLATGEHTLNRHHEAVKQAAVADVLLLTKADRVSDLQRAALSHRLARINPAAPRHEVSGGQISPALVLNLGLFNADGKSPDVARWLKEEMYASATPVAGEHEHAHEHQQARAHGDEHEHTHEHDINRHDDHIRAFCFAIDEPIAEATLHVWLDTLMSFVGSNILRVKAILNVQGQAQPVVVHGVQHVFHPPVSLPAWPTEDRRSRLVFITHDVDQQAIEKTFDAFRPLASSGTQPISRD